MIRMRSLVICLLMLSWSSSAWSALAVWPGPRRDVRAFGAKGDGVNDDTRAIQAAIDSLPRSGGTVVLPPGIYRSGNLLVSNCEGVRLLGVGATVRLFGKSPPPGYVGIQLHGTLRRVAIEGLSILGDGQVESRHAGLWMTTASHDMVNMTVRDCKVRSVVNGIRFDNTMGRLTEILIEGNLVEHCVGTQPGEGYGIVHSNGGRTAGAAVILGNTIVGAQRHSIYQSAGSGAKILGNHIIDHRLGVADGRLRAAIAIARSRDVFVAGNKLDRCADATLSIEPSESDLASPSGRVRVTGNVFVNSPGRDIWVGAEVVGPGTGRLEQVVIEHNVFSSPSDPTNRTESIRIADGKHVIIRDNLFVANQGFRVPYAAIVATALNGSRLDGLDIGWNVARFSAGEGGSVALVELGAEIASGDRAVTIRGQGLSSTTSPSLLVKTGPRTNPNLFVESPETTKGRSETPHLDLPPLRAERATHRGDRSAKTRPGEDLIFRPSFRSVPLVIALFRAQSVPPGPPFILVRVGTSIGLLGTISSSDNPPTKTSRIEKLQTRSFILLLSDRQPPWLGRAGASKFGGFLVATCFWLMS